MIQSGEYRYLSPVIAYDQTTGVVGKLISAALTNNPALDGMEEVAALSLVHPHKNESSTDVAALMHASNELLAALRAKTAEAEQSRTELAALRRQLDDARLAALIDDATHGGRLLAYHVEAARKLGKVDLAALSTLLDRPPLVPLGTQTDALRARGWNPDAARPAALTSEKRHVATLGGRTPQEFAALKARFTTEESGHTD